MQIQKAKDAGADMIFLPIYYSEASLILKQTSSVAGFSPKFFGCDGMDGILALDNFDAKLAEGLMFMTPFDAASSDETIKTFVDNFNSKYGHTPNQFAADAYDAIYIIKDACEKAGVKDGISNSDLCDALKDALTKVSFNGVTGKNVVWEANGEPNKEPSVLQIKDGKYVTA